MSKVLVDLIEILEDQKECYENILVLLDYQKNALIQKDIELLVEITERQEAFTARIQLLESKREESMKQLLGFFKLEKDQITLLNIIKFYNKNLEHTSRLADLRIAIINLIGEIKEASKLNEKLLQQNLEGVNFSLNALNSLMFQGQNLSYNKIGKDEQPLSESSFFDVKG